MKKLTLILAYFLILTCFSHAQTLYFSATDTVHNIAMPLDSVYIRCNTNGADTTLYNNPEKLEIGGLLGVEDNQSETAFGIKLSAMNFSNGRLYVMVTSPKPDNVSFLLSDLTGRTLINSTQFCVPGSNNFALDAPGINAGMYFLTISNGFLANSYKVLGINSGSGDITVTNIGFPIKTVLAGTSDFTIICYATGKIVAVLSDTINNYTPVGNDTVKFDFGDEWSKWKFKKLTLNVYNLHLVGDGTSTTSNGHESSTQTYGVDTYFNYKLLVTMGSNEYYKMYHRVNDSLNYSDQDTVKISYGYDNSNITIDSVFTIKFTIDSISKTITNLVINNEFLTGSYPDNAYLKDDFKEYLTYWGQMLYSIDNTGKIISQGKFDKNLFHYNYSRGMDRVFTGWWIISNEFVKDANENDLNFTLTLEP